MGKWENRMRETERETGKRHDPFKMLFEEACGLVSKEEFSKEGTS